MHESYTLLLTATIDPRDTPYVLRTNPALRFQDYTRSIRRWLLDPCVARLVFCENSGHDLTPLSAAIRDANPFGKEVLLFSYRLPGSLTCRGKGFGELDIIAHAVARLDLGGEARLLKVTGRYYVENMAEIAADLRSRPEASVVSSAPDPPYGVPSACFFANKSFLEDCLVPMREKIDDRDGFWFEHALEQAIAESVQRGLVHAIFRREPLLAGISGSGNVPWGITRAAEGISIPLSSDYGAFLLRVLEFDGGPSGLTGGIAERLACVTGEDLTRVTFSPAEIHLLIGCLTRSLEQQRTSFDSASGAALLRLLHRLN